MASKTQGKRLNGTHRLHVYSTFMLRLVQRALQYVTFTHIIINIHTLRVAELSGEVLSCLSGIQCYTQGHFRLLLGAKPSTLMTHFTSYYCPRGPWIRTIMHYLSSEIPYLSPEKRLACPL